MPKIFICYSRVDQKNYINPLVELLRRKYGLSNIWFDEHVVGGMDWWEEILRQIEMCDVFVYLLSNESVESKYCQAEFTEAQRLGRPIVTVQVRDRTRIPSQLSRIQYVDMAKGVTDGYALTILYEAIEHAATLKHPKRANWRPATACPEVVTMDEEVEQGENITPDTRTLPIARPALAQQNSRSITPIQATLWVAVIGGIFALLVAGITILPDMLNGAEATPTHAVSQFEPSDTPTQPIAAPTTAVAQLPTERDTPTTPPHTLSAQEIVDQQETQTATHKPPTVTDTSTPTLTPTDTFTPTATANWTETIAAEYTARFWQTATAVTWTPTPTNTPTLIPTLSPLEKAQIPVEKNDDWEPYSEELDGVEMVLVPAGCFMMGSTDGESDERDPHEICFDEPFWIDKYEVNNAQYGRTGCESHSSDLTEPRNCINWFSALAFCRSRDAHLPTEAEWEYVARGPDNRIYPWGDEFNGLYLNCSKRDCASDVYQYSSPVGSFPSGVSWVGAFDMSGNLWEWTNSKYQDYPYDAGDGREKIDNDGSLRVLRGGSFQNSRSLVRASTRYSFNPSNTSVNFGFRCARSIN